MKLVDLGLSVHPGSGVVCRAGAAVVAIFDDPASEVAAELVALVRTLGDDNEPGRAMAHRLAGVMTHRQPGEIPNFVALGDDPDGIVAVLHGDVELTATGAETTSLSGRDRPTWVDAFLPADVMEITAAPAGAGIEPAGFASDLEAGIVPGGAITLAMRSAEQEPQPQPQPQAEPQPEPEAELEPEVAATFTSIDLRGDTEDRAPLPIAEASDEAPAAEVPHGEVVEGIKCIRGHFNHPDARYCAHCGIAMVQQTRILVKDIRPPLGILVFDNGMAFTLDKGYVIGRDPSGDTGVAEGTSLPLELSDEDKVLSRVHAEIRVKGWEADVVDRDSANGTFVRPEGNGSWRRLAADAPERLLPAMQVKVGNYSFTFDSHHRQGQG